MPCFLNSYELSYFAYINICINILDKFRADVLNVLSIFTASVYEWLSTIIWIPHSYIYFLLSQTF